MNQVRRKQARLCR